MNDRSTSFRPVTIGGPVAIRMLFCRRSAWVVIGFALLMSGCQRPPSFNDLESLTEDDGGDGFLDVEPPPGVAFDPVTNLKIRVSSTLGPNDLAPHAEEAGVDPNLVGLADIFVNFSFSGVYADGSVVLIRETEPLAPFSFAFEASCPETSDLSVELIIAVPFAALIRVPVGITLDVVDFECGDTIEFATFVNDNGEVDETVQVR